MADLKFAAVRAGMRDPGRLPALARARPTTTTEDAGAMQIAIIELSTAWPGRTGR